MIIGPMIVVRRMRMTVRSAVAVRVWFFDKSDAPGCGYTQQQQCGEGDSVVRMEGDFRQQIGERNAEEYSRSKGECTADDERLLADKVVDAKHKANGAEGAHHGKAGVGDEGVLGAPAASFHQRGDGQSIERFVEQYGEERAEAKESESVPTMRLGSNRSAEREAVDDGVEAQSDGESDPVERASARLHRGGMTVIVTMAVIVIVVAIGSVLVRGAG